MSSISHVHMARSNMHGPGKVSSLGSACSAGVGRCPSRTTLSPRHVSIIRIIDVSGRDFFCLSPRRQLRLMLWHVCTSHSQATCRHRCRVAARLHSVFCMRYSTSLTADDLFAVFEFRGSAQARRLLVQARHFFGRSTVGAWTRESPSGCTQGKPVRTSEPYALLA